MKSIRIIFIITSLTLICLTSCNDPLSKSPDSRASLDSPEQISKLLAEGYSTANYGLIGDLSSDNFIDNNSPDENGNMYHLSSQERMHDEIFAWEDAVSSQDTDSPSAIWSGCYHSIAVANQALEQIAKFEAEGSGEDVKAQKGEALLIRAYHHFILVNIFCNAYRNDALSKNDSGVPYMTTPETKVLVKYLRSNVAATYNNIEKDLLEGINLISDAAYKVPKYHFNKKAAYAFATRFYLFKRNYQKVVDYSTAILGTSGKDHLRNWNNDYPTYYSFRDGWIDATSSNNFMLLPTNSLFNRIFGTRYGCNRDASRGTILGTGPTWQNYNYNPCYLGRLFMSGAVEYGAYFPKSAEFFEYTDKIAGIGYPHVIRAEFTGEETLLCRAEAYVFLNQISNAIADLKTFDDSHKMTESFTYTDLTENVIRSFYTSAHNLFVKTYNTEKLSPDYIVSANQKPLIDCVLHFRRMETLYDGMRWFDIKRYGIEITHKIGSSRVETLKWDDPRRAIQIPAEIISAGFSPNYRTSTNQNNSDIINANISLIYTDNVSK
jgi:starch-binding outer membrane protein, SusD/RagB family